MTTVTQMRSPSPRPRNRHDRSRRHPGFLESSASASRGATYISNKLASVRTALHDAAPNLMNISKTQAVSPTINVPPRTQAPRLPDQRGIDPLAPTAGTMEMSRIHAAVRRAKLMMVDDELVNLKALEKNLRRSGYEDFVTTTDSTQALSLVDQERPDILLLDIMMPEVNGLDVLRALRADVRHQYLPVIILTAYCDADTRREALQAGCTDFLAKPVDPHELGLRVRNVLVAKAFYDHVAKHAEQLESEVSRKTNELANAQHEAQVRYLTGKAEIATDVLHNVGNALNSVNVGVNLIAFTIRDSKIRSLKRAVDLLHEQGDNLARFLTKDERGRVLPSYLYEVTQSLLAERDKIVAELELLAKHVEHINAVVATQQKYARVCHVTEDVSLVELLGDIEELMGGTLARHEIEIVRHYEDVPPVQSDRQRLMQVVLNVIKNAIDSLKLAHASGQGRLELRIAPRGDNRVVIEISDNGVGISPENLIKVFSHGFTTKKDGHGFGLHSCGNIMQELGGAITVRSEGLNQGATFTLEIPLRRPEQ